MTLAYFDCFAGAAGDMIVGALLDAGADFAQLQTQLAKLRLDSYGLRAEAVRRGGIGGIKFHVDIPGMPENQACMEHVEAPGHGHEHAAKTEGETPMPRAGETPATHSHSHHHRGLTEILAIIDAAGLPARVVERAKRIFQTLGAAEAKVHRVPVEEVHFHEVGAVDSIVDIVGACIALELLGVDEVVCSPIPAGSGTVHCAHGELPAPAPATAAMLVGATLAINPLTGEVTTPTAAAILTTLAKSYGPLPAMAVQSVGYGAGTRQGDSLPNLLRVFVGQGDEAGQVDTVVELSANIDDTTGEVLGHTLLRLMEVGCLDSWAIPLYMKKNRPAFMVSALCLPADADMAQSVLFQETSTFGVRRVTLSRSKLERSHQVVQTVYGPVRVKVGKRRGQVLSAAPEFADCQAAARSHHVSVKEVMEATMSTWRTGCNDA